MQSAAWNSLKVAAIATMTSVVLGTLGALGLARSRWRWARALDALFMSPLLLPPLAFGFAALMAFSLAGVRLSLDTLALGHVAVCAPFVLRTTTAAPRSGCPRPDRGRAGTATAPVVLVSSPAPAGLAGIRALATA